MKKWTAVFPARLLSTENAFKNRPDFGLVSAVDIINKLIDATPPSFRLYCLVAAIGIIGFHFVWANYFSRRATLENKRRELEILKLCFEIAALKGGEKPCDLITLEESLRAETQVALRQGTKVTSHDKKTAENLLLRQWHKINRSRRCCHVLVSAGSALFYAIVMLGYAILHTTTPSADTLNVIFWIYAFVTGLSVIGGGIAGSLCEFENKFMTFIFGFVVTACLFPIYAKILIWLVDIYAKVRTAYY